ncbi:hypothetical protein J3A64_004827 [Pseudarthrobacter sp. PvP004]|uniref:hypothetical protein n=1 Tax=Pseudarthrobacter sp. PvP004 TaxID=2817850 RepID=UPI001AE192B5|nr:hypothetical protein [Pseudarthrobacter sp. PvP004]MBP2269287.1 hypothetical protein [Pseudarthrobacter sp. PvP004]
MSAPGSTEIGILAYREAMVLDAAAVINALCGLLGQRLVAYIGSVKETRAVRQWIAKERAPSQHVVKVLRDAYHIAVLLNGTNSPEVVQAWFQGMNPLLDDQPPAKLLREGETDEAAHRVLAAARAFCAV